MLPINYKIFNENLLVTQIYCDTQLSNTDKNFASLFRSINPTYSNEKLFQFTLNKIPTAQEEKFFYLFLVNWKIDPGYKENLYEELFAKQLQIKYMLTPADNNKSYEGQVFIFEIDGTLNDGAAAVSSHGFLDDYNCPPIDTWFYLTKEGDNRLLFAWVPKEFISYFDDGISVNPEGCIRWFLDYPKEIKETTSTNKRTKFLDFIYGLPKFMKK